MYTCRQFLFFQLIVTRRRSYFNVASAIEMIKLLLLLLLLLLYFKKGDGWYKEAVYNECNVVWKWPYRSA